MAYYTAKNKNSVSDLYLHWLSQQNSDLVLFFDTVPEEKEMPAKVLNNNKAQR